MAHYANILSILLKLNPETCSETPKVTYSLLHHILRYMAETNNLIPTIIYGMSYIILLIIL